MSLPYNNLSSNVILIRKIKCQFNFFPVPYTGIPFVLSPICVRLNPGPNWIRPISTSTPGVATTFLIRAKVSFSTVKWGRRFLII